jgi:uncharacterized membrane protein YgcG
MSGFEWFLLVAVVIAVPLVIAVVVTLWTLEQARARNRRNRGEAAAVGVKRKATRSAESADAGSTVAETPRDALSGHDARHGFPLDAPSRDAAVHPLGVDDSSAEGTTTPGASPSDSGSGDSDAGSGGSDGGSFDGGGRGSDA